MAKISNKKRGNKTELKYAKLIEKLMGEKIFTTRNISTITDNNKVDLENSTLSLPYKFQCKGGLATPKFWDILKQMKANYPEHPAIILYEKKIKKNDRLYTEDDYVIMTYRDFEKIIENNSK